MFPSGTSTLTGRIWVFSPRGGAKQEGGVTRGTGGGGLSPVPGRREVARYFAGAVAGGVLSGMPGPSCLGEAPFIHAGGSIWFVERSFSLQTNSIIS
jgi:hypothetical protein